MVPDVDEGLIGIQQRGSNLPLHSYLRLRFISIATDLRCQKGIKKKKGDSPRRKHDFFVSLLFFTQPTDPRQFDPVDYQMRLGNLPNRGQ